MNPILPGEAISNKEFVLDIQIFLNNNTYLNLELQVEIMICFRNLLLFILKI